MNSYSKRFLKLLPKWVGWGAACASLSFMCAWVFGDAGGVALVAMIAGVLSWSGLCAAVTATERYQGRVEADGGAWAKALRVALIVRVGMTLPGMLVLVVGSFLPLLRGLSVFLWPDFWAGILSIRLGRRVLGGFDRMSSEMPRSFGGVYATTLVQGAWVIGSLVALAVVCYGVRRLAERRRIRVGS